MKIIITGATGMVGEGVLMECLENSRVDKVLSVSRRPCGRDHPKLEEYIIPEFLELKTDDPHLAGYDGCFFCAGVSSIGMTEADYARMTYDITIHFAGVVLQQNPGVTFVYVSGTGTDSTEKGRMMWARVKGKTENALSRMPFKKIYNFRPGFMQATKGQKNTLSLYKYLGWTFPFFKAFFPRRVSTLKQVGSAMINAVSEGYPKQVLEVPDINLLAGN